ncbi:MAG: SwmB domain-containing protein, partial [Acidobacteria bacterium]|nr:SwmB domain-containing protein [Acidobacteriota bacterium]
MSRRRPTAYSASRRRLSGRPAALLLLALVAVLFAALSAASPALSEDEPQPAEEPAELTVSVRASADTPFAGEEVSFSAVISDAPADEQPTYQWELSYGGAFWFAAGSDPTFSYLPHQPETASVRVTVSYPSGVAATSEPLSVTWRAFVPTQQPPSRELVRTAVESVSVSIGFDEDESEPGRPARLVAVVSNLPDGDQPRYRWEMNLGDRWRAVGTDRVFPWTTRIPETARFRVTVFYGSGESVTSDELELAWAAGRATRDVTAAQTSTVLISNDGQPSIVGNTSLALDQAQSFTTGSHSSGYKLTGVEIRFAIGGSISDYSVKILSDSSGSPGSTEVGTLTTLSSVVTGLNEFTGDVDLDADTTYYVVLDTNVSTGSVALTRVTSDDEDSGGAAGWSIGNAHHFRSFGSSGSWTENTGSRSLKIVVNGYAVTLPALDSAEVDGTELVLTFDDDLDTASGTAAGAFMIKAGGGAAQAAT